MGNSLQVQTVATLTGQDLQPIEKTGWGTSAGQDVRAVPTAVAANPHEQTLNIGSLWPQPTPKARLYVTWRVPASEYECAIRGK